MCSFCLFPPRFIYLLIYGNMMKHVYTIKRARGRRRSDIDTDTYIDISYMRGAFWEVPVPIISVDVHLGYH